jgi:Flp pilus assembly secretin CpaC
MSHARSRFLAIPKPLHGSHYNGDLEKETPMRVLRPLVAAAAALFLFAAPASARDIRVALDQAFPIRLSEAAEGVAIGNPTIAGVTVQNDMFLFVTGRSYGSTNLVVVGQNGRVLYSGRVVVTL